MSKSQIKRLHQQQELEKTASLEDDVEDSVPVPRKGPANRFAFFDDEGNEEAGEQSDDGGNQEGTSESVTEQKIKKNKAKKNKKKAKKAAEEKETEETDNAMLARLAAMNMRQARQQAAEAASDGYTKPLEELMKIDIKMFDMSAEIKRKLGKAFKDVATPEEQAENRWPPGRRAVGRIIKNKPRWFPDRDCGLSMVEVERKGNIVWFKLQHNKAYATREEMFLSAEKNMEVDLIQEMFALNPYHLNVLILLSNMNRMNDELNSAADLIERGIWYVDQHSAPTFEPFNWRHRLDYLEYNNRAFYLLLHRHMLNAAHKRCFETAWNTAKMIFKLDPIGDPLAVATIIDVYALKAKQYQWVIDFYEEAKAFKNLDLLPNWPYSIALAKFYLAKSNEEKEDAKQHLCKAIRHFPSVVVKIMDVLQIHPDSAVMNCKMLTSFVADNEKDSLKLIIKIYTKQSEELWKVPETLLFLEEATRKVATSTDKDEIAECDEWKVKRNKMYHLRANQIDRFAQLLEEIPAQSLTNPIPPKNGRDSYANASRQANIPHFADGNMLTGFINSLLPNYTGENSLQEEFMTRGGDIARLFNLSNMSVERFREWWNQQQLNEEDVQHVLAAIGDEVVELPEGGPDRRTDDSDEEQGGQQ